MTRSRILPIALLLCSTAAVRGQNLLANPGFEQATPGNYWQLWKNSDSTGGEAALTFPDTGAHEGTRYARVEVKAPSLENWQLQLQLPPDWMSDSGATYELKFWARSDSSTSIHLGIQEGPDLNFTYRSGMDFALSPEWMEQTLIYESDRTGNGALRFNLYVGRYADVYGFDGFSLTRQTVGVRSAGNALQGLRVLQDRGSITLSLAAGASEDWKAELLDLRGKSVATASAKAGAALTLAKPREGGAYVVRAFSPTRSWIRTVSLP